MAKSSRVPPRSRRLPLILTVALFAACLLLYFAGEQAGLFPSPPAANEYTGLSSGKTLEVHFIDVGQGDSILIKAPGGNALIDASVKSAGPVVYDYLDSQGVESLDLVIVTHPHADHVGGMAHVLSSMDSVGAVILPDLPDDLVPTTRAFETFLDAVEERDLSLTTPRVGQTYSLGADTVLTILGPVAQYDDLNNNSVVCRLDFGSTSFLLTGDSELRAEWELLERGGDVSAQVLKLGHHGSDTSTDADWLKEVAPQLAIASCGLDNSYGHPHQEVLQLLDHAGVTVCRTDLQGSIVVVSDGTKLTVTTQH